MTKLGEVAKLSARGTLKKGKDFTTAELDRAAQKLNDALDKLNMSNGYSTSLPGAGGMEVRLANNQFSSFHSGKTGGGNNVRIYFGSSVKSNKKLTKQIQSRGWTEDSIKNLVNNSYTTRLSTNRATGNTATVHY